VPRPSTGKWVTEKTFVNPPLENCYIYKRPNSTIWQYYLAIEDEGEERKSTKQKDKQQALRVAQERYLEVMSRKRDGLKARRVKKMFDFIDDFLAEQEKRIRPSNQRGFITKETFRVKTHHLNLLKRFYHDKNIKLEDLDYPKIYTYPVWRTIIDENWNPKPPLHNHTILTELTTIRGYFEYLFRLGYISRVPEFQKIQRESLRNMRRDYLNPKEYMQTINTLRAWANSKSATPSQLHNRKMVYQAILIMANSCMRIGELRKLRWMNLEANTNLSKEQQQVGHLIKITADITKVGESRTIQSPTTKRFDEIRNIVGIAKHRSEFPHVSPDLRGNYVISKYGKPDCPLGMGTWNRLWKEIKDMCAEKYWSNKNITYYSFRHTGISFMVSRGVPILQLCRNAGCGSRYVEDVYYHHESESKVMWETLMKNRNFNEQIRKHENDLLLEIENACDAIAD